MAKKQYIVPVYLTDIEVASFLYRVEVEINELKQAGVDLIAPEIFRNAEILREKLNIALSSFAPQDQEMPF